MQSVCSRAPESLVGETRPGRVCHAVLLTVRASSMCVAQRPGSADGDVVWYSDDGGSTYALAAGGHSQFAGGWSEAQMAESSDGSVVAVYTPLMNVPD